MLFLKGSKAYTPFRLNQILIRLQKKIPTVSDVTASFGYFVATTQALTPKRQQQLEALLPGSRLTELPSSSAMFSCWVVPRFETISPWSSKATDIAHICGLAAIARIERGIFYEITLTNNVFNDDDKEKISMVLHDPMIETVIIEDDEKLAHLFQQEPPRTFKTIDVINKGAEALMSANKAMGLALSDTEITYLVNTFQNLSRNPTDVELMMFAQVNSEHCRHKRFNAQWIIDGQARDQTLFSMIKNTYAQHPNQVLIAYKDNAAVLKGHTTKRLFINPESRGYETISEHTPIVLKVETHNHPTAISPFPGAATGSGGEIRDEAATGRGAQAKAGLAGFSVSHLHIPGFSQPWETCVGKPKHMASALEIMLQGPVGAAAFNNEFGRPNLCGYFRTFEMMVVSDYGDICRGYHKPIMIAGGIGNIRSSQIEKANIPPDTQLIVMGGPAMTIGLGGGAASSRSSTEESEQLDFASVQRANPEMQRRAQEVINTCIALGEENPIFSIHDVGAGGLSNALPELVAASGLGARFNLYEIPVAESGMTPLEIWCNESQERYVLAIKSSSLSSFKEIAMRERCPYAVVGVSTQENKLVLVDQRFNNFPIDIAMSALFDDVASIQCEDNHVTPLQMPLNTQQIEIAAAVKRVLQFPCVSDKSFLITIGDRSVGGLVARDQMVGPWQVPVSDVAVTCTSFDENYGEALAMGERAPIALLHHAASARMAVGEAITNMAAAPIKDISKIALSANWMAAADYPGEAAGLYDAVQTIGMELCPTLGISVPVGKDSLSMRTTWEEKGQIKNVTAPMSLIITAAAPATDVRKTLTPQLQTNTGKTQLILIDLGKGANCLGGSCLAQTYNLLGERPPDVDDPTILRDFFNVIQLLNAKNLILSYHDRSDGGLLATICEMAFAAHIGVTIQVDDLGGDPIASLFTEELGAVIQVKAEQLTTVFNVLQEHQLEKYSHVIGTLNNTDEILIRYNSEDYYRASCVELHRLWSETSFRLQAMRDHSECAQQQFDQLLLANDPGLNVKLPFDMSDDITAPYIKRGVRPRIAILREQGVNGHMEMAAAFQRAGFECIDVHMSDLLNDRVRLKTFKGIAACGGFSYGDVLDAGRGWAQSILMHPKVRAEFHDFFERKDTFALGTCNGCQMFSYLKELIPGTAHWPEFHRNKSEQFEARLSLVHIPESSSLFFRSMSGSILPVSVAHGEGLAVFKDDQSLQLVKQSQLITLEYVDHHHQVTEVYPANPNGSPHGITGLTNTDGRVTILMPHPERVFRTVQYSWHPKEWQEDSPWMRFFRNARVWVN